MSRSDLATDDGQGQGMLRIWGRLSSINVQKVVWCARELHLDHERIDIGHVRNPQAARTCGAALAIASRNSSPRIVTPCSIRSCETVTNARRSVFLRGAPA